MLGAMALTSTDKRFVQLYAEARYGMLPTSWSDLGLGPEEFYLEPIEVLASKQLQDDNEHCERCHEFRRFVEDPEFSPSDSQLGELALVLLDLSSKAESRREQARHCGMLLCRAFFKYTESDTPVNSFSPEVVESILEYLRG